ncbi:MAG: hypothetical protein WBK20_03115 [Spirochaetota bacterium]
MEIDTKEQSNDINFTNEKEAIFALQMYMNRFMWISTKEIVSGITCFYSDTKPKKDADL